MSADSTLVKKASELTADSLRTVAKNISVQQLSRLTLPEIESVVQLISRIVPAGNVPGMILSGLARLPGRRIPAQKLEQDVTALFSGVEQILDKAVYATFFAGPAAVLWGYQNILKLAGKDPESAFPEGLWQFYAEYALREDTARHTNETHGFDTTLNEHGIRLDKVDRLTAWFMAAVTCLRQYPALLENEWRERVSISLFEKIMREAGMKVEKPKRILREWETKRPYRRDEEAQLFDYPVYRQKKFDNFLRDQTQTTPEPLIKRWKESILLAEGLELSAYQKQMSILAALEPGLYGESREPYTLTDAKIGIIHNDSYYLLPVCDEGGNLLDVNTARAQIASLLSSPVATPSQIASLTRIKRSALAGLRSKLSPELVSDLDNLKYAPILLSTDLRERSLPLSELRQTERGVGSHAMTIFDTGETFVFDQSHIFFDGAWGTALAEIMTNEALSWARYLSMLPSTTPASSRLYTSLTLQLSPTDLALVEQSPHIMLEAGAESDKVDIKTCLALRRGFKQRSQDTIDLTVNDLLILYRAIHAATYVPSKRLSDEIQKLSASQPDLAAALKQLVEEGSRTNPSILIPMDATLKAPRDRVYPMSIEVPLTELNLLAMHEQTLRMLSAYQSASGNDRGAIFDSFNSLQRVYLAHLQGLGTYFSRAKDIAAQGESTAVGAIKLLAHLPLPIQRLLDKIPERFEVLNNLIKGREVISNVGAVAPSSTLTRFMTAKDDNNQKQLAWGVITDARNVMHIHLRDFRPHVNTLYANGRRDLALLIAQDYLDAYIEGFNRYIRELSHIIVTSNKTMPRHPKGKLLQ